MNQHTKLRGLVKVDILDHLGAVVRAGRWQRNLVLDQGLNRLATVVICDLFKVAVKGNDASVVKEIVPGSNSYTLNTGLAHITRTAGTRDFTSDDIGKLVRSDTGQEAIITSITSVTVADVRGVGLSPLVGYANRDIIIFAVDKVGMDTEAGRTETYGNGANDNGFTTIANARTYKRTFIFDEEPANIETPGGVTCDWTGTTITKTAGTRAFTADDEGKYIELVGASEFAKITNYLSATQVVVDRAPSTPRTGFAYRFHGFNSYSHIGFSDLSDPGDNLNILVRMEDISGNPVPIKALGINPETPGQQVKITYQHTATFGPNTVGSDTAAISDPETIMGGGGKAGSFCLEALSTSTVSSLNGETVLDSLALEPSQAEYVALSQSSAALVPIGSGVRPDRSPGVATAPATLGDYVDDEFSRVVTGTFGINDGNANNWRSMGLYDMFAASFAFTFLFNAAQKKPNTHQLTLRFRKSWNRDLS